MPYIKYNRRQNILGYPDCYHDNVNIDQINTSGELTYVIVYLCIEFLIRSSKSLDFDTLNDIPKVLNAAKDEYTRRILVPYEEKKCQENGDVFKELLHRLGLE